MSSGDRKRKQYQIQVIADRCKGCGFCIDFCPQEVLRKSAEANRKGYHIAGIDPGKECTGCNMCSMVCPDFAINVVPVEEGAGVKSV